MSRRAAPTCPLASPRGPLAASVALAGCGGNADPFAGLYWEPSSGRRVEIRKDGDAYRLYYGATSTPTRPPATGKNSCITEPMGGQTIVRPRRRRGALELDRGQDDGLKPLPQHQ